MQLFEMLNQIINKLGLIMCLTQFEIEMDVNKLVYLQYFQSVHIFLSY